MKKAINMTIAALCTLAIPTWITLGFIFIPPSKEGLFLICAVTGMLVASAGFFISKS